MSSNLVREEMRQLYRKCFWSDLFFNWPHYDNHKGVRENARAFLAQLPGCPFGLKWLCDDYRKRL